MAGWTDLAIAAGNATDGSLDPSALVPIAQSSTSPADAAVNAQATAHMTKTADQVQAMQTQTPDQQAKAWKTLSKIDQAAYVSAGYKPPAQHETGIGGFLNHYVVHDVLAPVGHALGTGFHDTTNALASPLRNVSHVLRSEQFITHTNNSHPTDNGKGVFSSLRDLVDLKPWEAVFSPNKWADAWRKTNKGEQTFDPYQDRQIQQQYGADIAGLAKEIASGENINNILAKYPDQGGTLNADGNTPRQEIAKKITGDPQMKAAVTQYQNAKLSFGREVVGSHFMTQHPLAGRILSGATDAVVDWYDDPMVAALGIPKAVSDARYLAQTPEDLQRLYNGSSSVRALYSHLGGLVQAGDAAKIAEQFPKLTPIADKLITEGATSPEAVNDFMKGHVGLLATMRGMAAKVGDEPGFIAPHLTIGNRVGQALTAPLEAVAHATDGVPVVGKTAAFLAHPVNFLADTAARIQDLQPGQRVEQAQQVGMPGHPFLNAALHPIATGEMAVGRTVRRMLTMDPSAAAKSFDAASPDALSNLKNLALTFLPKQRADELMNAYAAADTLGLKFNIYRGLLDELGKAAGVEMTPEGAEYWRKFTSEMGDNAAKRQYSTDGIDAFMEGSQQRAEGLLENHMQTEWGLPSFRQMFAQSKKMSVTRSVMGTINNSFVDHLMQSVWKPLTLMHLGFTIRTSLDELLGATLREGVGGLTKGRLAGSSLDTGTDLLPYHPVSRIWDSLTGHLPDAVKERINTPSDLIAEHLGDKTARAVRNVDGKLASDQYVQGARQLYEHGYLDNSVPEMISATHGRAAGYMEDGPTVHKIMQDGQVRKVEFRPTGDWRNYAPTEQLYHTMWGNNLTELARSGWARTAMEQIDANPQERVAAVADAIQANPEQWAKSVRSLGTSDGRRIVTGEVTAREAALDHAQRVVDHVDSLVKNTNGELLSVDGRSLPEFLLDKGKAPTDAALAEIPPELVPTGVRGQDVIPVPVNKFQSLVSKGFDNLVGRPMNWMVRQPLFIHNYVESRQAVEGLAQDMLDKYGPNANIDKILTDVAVDRAINKTIPYIHDPGVRSQMSVITRNLSPFWFAQEQALKRWARTFQYAPQAMRQMQLLNNGLQHSGIIHTDQQSGQKFFLYPGADFADRQLNKLAETLTGTKFTLPIGTDLQGSTKFLSPIRDGVLPSFSPVVAMPLTALVNHFPELQPVKQAVLAHAGNAQYLKEMVPSTLYSVIDAIAPDMVGHAQYNSAWMQTIQSWMATGHALGPNATPEQIQTLMDRTKNYTRTRIMLRTLLGFGAPASPQFALDNLHGDLQQLMTELPVSEALSVFQQLHPDATAFTVFQSKSASGAPLPATTDAMNWMNNNHDLIKRYPYAAGYLMPQTPGKYDPTAYQEQLATGLRIRKTPQQFLDDILYQQAAGPYFKQDQQKNQLLAQIHSSFQRNKVSQAWTAWSQQYMLQNPVFSKIMQGGADGLPAAKWERTQTQGELGLALNKDPALRDNPDYATLRTLVNSYDNYQATIARYNAYGNTYYAHIRKQLGEAFAYNTLQYVHNHPETEGYFHKVIRPAMSASITALGVTA